MSRKFENINNKFNIKNKENNQKQIENTEFPVSGIRLNKYLAQAGICSRREADQLIESGVVSVNGIAAKAGDRVFPNDEVICNHKVVGKKQDTVVLAYYKPVGVVCSQKDRHADKLVSDQLQFPVRVTYAGRLDKDSEGLLLMTNDGNLIDKLMRGANRHEKEYVVKVKKDISDDFLNKMSNGIYLKELEQTTRPCRIEAVGKRTFRIILTQGLNRQIRRMCEASGQEVLSLKRVRVANVELGKLKPGEYRVVSGEELKMLYKESGIQA
ncbi:MAG: pseudouridine synthase [Lachnospiraceae bacterium]|nr:pseudouridine synthase [Lachnospiraceae bacterium]